MRQTEEFCYSSDEGFDENDSQPNDRKSPIYKIGEYVGFPLQKFGIKKKKHKLA